MKPRSARLADTPSQLSTSSRLATPQRRAMAAVLVVVAVASGATSAGTTAGTTAAGETAAAAVLTAMADRLEPTSADHQAGMYQFIETAMWHRQGDPNDDSGPVIAEHVRRWIAADRSGRVITARLRRPPGFDMTRVSQADQRVANPDSATVTDYPAFTMPPTGGDLHGQLLQLQARQQHRPPAGCATDCGPLPPYDLVDTLAGLHTIELLGRRERATVLRILALVAALRYGGPVTDPAGLTGVQLSLDTDNVRRLVLILHPRTGELLAYQRWIHGHGLHTHIVCLQRAHTPELGDASGPHVQRIPHRPADQRK